MVLFTKEYFPISVLCFLSLIFWTQILKIVMPSHLVTCSFQARSSEYALKSARKRAIVLRWAKVSHLETLVRFLKWAAFSVFGLTHLSVPLSMDPTMQTHIQEKDVPLRWRLNFCIPISFFENTHYKVKCLPGFLSCLIYLVHPV